MVPTAANGQSAFAVYQRTGADGQWAAHAIQVLTLADDKIAAMTVFVPPTGPRLFVPFGCRLPCRRRPADRMIAPANSVDDAAVQYAQR